MAFLYMFV
jgi:hypothetical protein